MLYAKLRGRIREVFGTQDAFAYAMGMNRVSLSHRLSGKLDWKSSEIVSACALLSIAEEEIVPYFFAVRVQETEQK